jgi:hypothetical protein
MYDKSRCLRVYASDKQIVQEDNNLQSTRLTRFDIKTESNVRLKGKYHMFLEKVKISIRLSEKLKKSLNP